MSARTAEITLFGQTLAVAVDPHAPRGRDRHGDIVRVFRDLTELARGRRSPVVLIARPRARGAGRPGGRSSVRTSSRGGDSGDDGPSNGPGRAGHHNRGAA
jgi:hypothetical protein